MGWAEWIRTVEVEPALEAGDAGRLADSVEALLRAGCRVVHLDAAAGDAAAAAALLAPLVRRHGGVLDVHVPDADFAALAAAGASGVTFDAAAVPDVRAAVARGRAAGLAVGVGVGGDEPLAASRAAAAGADLVLLASAAPSPLDTVREVRRRLPDAVALQVEGVTHASVRGLYEAGARLLVADGAIFEREDLPRAYRRLVAALA